jgi:ABC-type transport system involved in multi-copper enzyme maturation permease subunit
MSAIGLIAKKERQALLRGQRGISWLLAFAAVLSGFSLLLISNRELSLLDNAEVVYMMAAVVIGAATLVAIILGADSFAGERERGSLVPLLSAPVTPLQLLAGKVSGLGFSWLVMCVLSLPYLWAVGASGQNLPTALLYLVLTGTPVVLGFGLLATAISARSGSVLSALVGTMSLLVVCASPLAMGPSLRRTAVAHALDLVNPFAAALNSLDSVVIDSDPLAAQLGRLLVLFVWFALTFLAASRTTRHPRFR